MLPAQGRARRDRDRDRERAITTLTKPFRSPLPQRRQSRPSRPANLTEDDGGHAQPGPSSAPAITAPRRPRQLADNSEFRALVKQRSALATELAQLRQALDTAQQAHDIETSGQDADLQRLISKWTLVAQEAADELYAQSRQRVESMGGLRAWEQRAKEHQLLLPQEGATPSRTNQAQLAGSSGRASEGHPQDGADGLEETAGEDDKSFTMETMLRQMGVDLDLIKYDKEADSWKDSE